MIEQGKRGGREERGRRTQRIIIIAHLLSPKAGHNTEERQAPMLLAFAPNR